MNGSEQQKISQKVFSNNSFGDFSGEGQFNYLRMILSIFHPPPIPVLGYIRILGLPSPCLRKIVPSFLKKKNFNPAAKYHRYKRIGYAKNRYYLVKFKKNKKISAKNAYFN